MALTTIDDRGLKTPIDLLDNEKIRFGTGNDLELYHDGTQSQITESGTGLLYINSNVTVIRNSAGGENQITAEANGSVGLYYDNSKKFETTSAGTTTTGNHVVVGLIACDGLLADDNEKIKLGSGEDLEIYHDGSNSYTVNATGNYLIKSGADIYIRTATNEEAITATANGAVALYYDNVKKFQTISSGVRLLGPEAGEVWAEFYADEGDDNADKWRMGASVNTDLFIQNYASGSWETNIKAIGNGAVELYYDNVKKLNTESWGVEITGTIRADDYTAQDDHKFKFGNSNDLQIWHDAAGGNYSYIMNYGAALLKLGSDQDIILGKTGNETFIHAKADGAVELYYDNSNKLSTASYGASVNDTKLALQVGSGAGSIVINRNGHITSNIRPSDDTSIVGGGSGGGSRITLNKNYLEFKTFPYVTNVGDAVTYTTRARIDGDGLKFGSDTAAANALDDYEEGTFTPKFGGSNNYSTYHVDGGGFYRKIGKMVYIVCRFNAVTLNASATGTAIVYNLPYAPVMAGSPTAYPKSADWSTLGVYFNSSYNYYWGASTGYGGCFQGGYSQSDANWASWSVGDFDGSGWYMDFSAWYST